MLIVISLNGFYHYPLGMQRVSFVHYRKAATFFLVQWSMKKVCKQ